ncbi:MAG: hypothetical protein EBV30_07475, partial [Actinobacteria bacterium]|nr:hypothetical protein [Actinomycetota bacterium]
MTSHDVRINIIPKSEAQTVIAAWNREDSYREMNSIARDLNQKARPYPYLASSEGSAATMNVRTSVPVDGPL